MHGLPGLKKVTLTASASKTGTAKFRAVLVRDWIFDGFENFNQENHREDSLVIFDISVKTESNFYNSEL